MSLTPIDDVSFEALLPKAKKRPLNEKGKLLRKRLENRCFFPYVKGLIAQAEARQAAGIPVDIDVPDCEWIEGTDFYERQFQEFVDDVQAELEKRWAKERERERRRQEKIERDAYNAAFGSHYPKG